MQIERVSFFVIYCGQFELAEVEDNRNLLSIAKEVVSLIDDERFISSDTIYVHHLAESLVNMPFFSIC